MKKINIDKSLSILIEEALKNSKNGQLSQLQIYTYITKHYKHADTNPKTSLKSQIRQKLRTSKRFTKCAKLDNNYLWRITIKDDFNLTTTPLHIGRYINLPLIKCSDAYKENVTIYNSIYYHIQDNELLNKKYSFKVTNIYDHNKAIGDYLRLYFAINRKYLVLKKKSLNTECLDGYFDDLLEEVEIKNEFVWKDVDYNYINALIADFCRKKCEVRDFQEDYETVNFSDVSFCNSEASKNISNESCDV
ncbi:hypothetical protein COBT_002029 [Conglomerata obtusa]